MTTPLQSATAGGSYHDYVWTGPRPLTLRSWLLCLAALVLAAVILTWSAQGTQLSWGELANGLPQIGDFLSRSFPPNWNIIGNLIAPAIETIQIALWGTLLGVIVAIPVSFLAARNLNRNRFVYQTVRQFLNVTRSINELILALVFVSAVGLGPFPGVLALALHGVGMVGKFFAESIEEIDDGPLEALRATGARPLQVIVFGVLPQVITPGSPPSCIALKSICARPRYWAWSRRRPRFRTGQQPQAVQVSGHRYLHRGGNADGGSGRHHFQSPAPEDSGRSRALTAAIHSNPH